MNSAEKIKKLFAKSDVTVPSKVDERIVGHALDAFDESGKTKSFSAGPNTWRMIMNKTMIKVTAAAAIIVIVIVGMHYLGVSPDGTGVVWADVLRNMEASQSVTFTLYTEGYFRNESYWGKGTVKIKGPIRRFDGISGRRSKYGQSGEETVIHMVDLSRQNRFVTLYPLKKCAETVDYHGYNPTLLTYDGLKKDFQNETGENLGEMEINGRKAVGFRIVKDDRVITVWADPDTALPIQIECKPNDTNDGTETLTLTNITFDVELDDRLFDMTIPDDYLAMNMSTEEFTIPFELTEKYLVEGLKVAAGHRGGKFPTKFGRGRPGQEAIDKALEEGSRIVAPIEDEFACMLATEYLVRLPKGSEWQYVGEDVLLGDVNTPVCWWKLPDSKTYRVIYGDLSIRDVEPGDLPKATWLEE
jgi:outer membrane lipoprotein-sorting protein